MLKTIKVIMNLPDNWDGEGSEAPISYSIKNAKLFAKVFSDASEGNLPKPVFSIEKQGALMCYWALENRTYIDISFDKENTFSLFKRTKEGLETYIDETELSKVNINWFNELLKYHKVHSV